MTRKETGGVKAETKAGAEGEDREGTATAETEVQTEGDVRGKAQASQDDKISDTTEGVSVPNNDYGEGSQGEEDSSARHRNECHQEYEEGKQEPGNETKGAQSDMQGSKTDGSEGTGDDGRRNERGMDARTQAAIAEVSARNFIIKPPPYYGGYPLQLQPSYYPHLYHPQFRSTSMPPIIPHQQQHLAPIMPYTHHLFPPGPMNVYSMTQFGRMTAPPTTQEPSKVASFPPNYCPTSGEIDDETVERARARKVRKNAQSRVLSARCRNKLDAVMGKPVEQRTIKEAKLVEEHEMKRRRKNQSSQERVLERRQKIDRILNKPEEERKEEENSYLNLVLGQKKRKIEGDRLRRNRLKELGMDANLKSPGIPARGPLPLQYEALRTTQGSKKQQQPPGDLV
jgi:hypothetical protein